MRWLLLLALSTGCRQLLGIEGAEVQGDGAIALDTPSDTTNTDAPIANGHDEDGDLIADMADNCPTIANSSQLTNGGNEPLGTACDPRTAEGDRIAVFFSFELPVRPDGIMGGNVFAMDHAELNGGELSTMNQFMPTRISAIFSNTTLPVGNPWINLRIGIYECRVGPCSGSGNHCMQAYGSNATSEVDVVLEPNFRLEGDQLDGKMQCRLYTTAGMFATMADATTAQNDRVRVRSNGVSATIDSLIVYNAP